MKILNCLFTTSLGGMEQSFLDYTASLTELGHQVIPVLHKKTKLLSAVQSPYFLNNNRSKHDPIALWQLKRFVKKEKPDLILTHGNRAHYLMNKIKGMSQSVGVCHGSFGYIINSDYIFTVSRELQNNLIDQYPNFKGKVSYIPNMIKITAPPHTLIPDFKHKTPVFGMISRIVKEKGTNHFIEALHLLKQNRIPFKAKIAGDGTEVDAVKELINKYNLNDEIEWLGWVHNKRDFFQQVDIVCIPSLMEPFGIVVLEALSHSKPVIVSNLPGPMEIVQHKQTAWVSQPGEPESIYQGMRELTKNPSLYQSLCMNGYQRALDFNAEKITQEIANTIQKI